MPKQDHLTRTRVKKAKALCKAGRLDEAGKLCEKICVRKGADSDTWSLLGSIYYRLGRHAEAVPWFQRAIESSPEDASACRDLANALLQLGNPDQAAIYYRQAVANRPGDPELLTNYAAVLMGIQRHSQAEPFLRTAISINPDLSQPYTNLGSCLNAMGKTDEALACYENALNAGADDEVIYSNYLLTRHYASTQDPHASLEAHRKWAEHYTGKGIAGHFHDDYKPGPDRKLRVGYVSPDFRTHSVACFLEPLLANHDKSAFSIYCYADVPRPDETTRRLKTHADCWRDTTGLNNAELARQIDEDRIDILVDLAGHTAGNRLKVFAQKPVPIQMTWLGYPDTTGLAEMDFRVSDSHADPSGFDDFYAEKLVRLKGCFVCYRPPADAPEVCPAPVTRQGCVTFGSFNNLAKINNRVIETWTDILRQVPGARLMIKNPGLSDKVVRERYVALFSESGIQPERIELKGVSPTTRDHLAEYRHVDISLDTFPYNGTTTTCEALWMGVPVLSLVGNCHANRVGSSLLHAVGMDEWITVSPEEYVTRAVALANDQKSIKQQRASLRQKIADSVLCDGPAFTAKMEGAYRAAWQEWCKTITSSST